MRKALLIIGIIILIIVLIVIFLASSDRSVLEEARWGYIDKTGATVIKPSFGLAESFSEGYALVYLPTDKAYPGARIINKQGTVLFEPPADVEILGPVKQGLAVIKNSTEPRYSKAGYITPSGTIAIPLTFNNADDFTADGLAHVALPDEKTSAFIDRSGKVVISGEYSDVEPFSEGLAGVCLKSTRRCGYIDTAGKFVISPTFYAPHSFSEGLATIIEPYGEKSRVAAITKQGKRLFYFNDQRDFIFSSETTIDFKEGLIPVSTYVSSTEKKGEVVELFGYVDKNGTYRIPPQFSKAESFSGGFAHVTTSTTDGTVDAYIDTTGKIRFTLSPDLRAESFSDGLARVYSRSKDRYGFIDTTGKMVIPLSFVNAENFSEGLTAVEFDLPRPGYDARTAWYNFKASFYAR